MADRLVGAAEDVGIELFHTPLGEPFIVIPEDDHHENWPLEANFSRSWLAGLCWKRFRKAAGSDVLSAALEVLKAKAIHDGPEEPVHLRTAWHENTLYYDLCDPSWRVVKVSPGQWEIRTSAPVRFRRYKTMAAQVEPLRGGSLNGLWEFLNIPDLHERRLVEAFLVAALIPGIPRPILVLFGDQGGGKTTAARLIGRLIDPSPAPLVRARDEAEFVQALSHRYVAIIDNLSYVQDWLSNLLSRAVTGEGFSKRKLYSDDDDILYSFRRVIILTGINLVVTKPDLLDRSLLVSTERLVERQRIPDRVLTDRFEAAQPTLFGALLDLLAGAMTAQPTVTVRLPRMADFAQWGAALAVAQGDSATRFEEDYQWNVTRQNEQAISESFVATLLLTFMTDRVTWQGTAENLLGYLQGEANSMGITRKDMPGTPQLLGRRLREVRPNLLSVGIDIAFSGHHHPRTITITRREAVK